MKTLDPGPDNKAYQLVKDTWPELDTSPTAPFKKLVLRSPFLQQLKADALEYYTRVLNVKNRNNVLPRDDYRQLAETSLILLGGTPPGGIRDFTAMSCLLSRKFLSMILILLLNSVVLLCSMFSLSLCWCGC